MNDNHNELDKLKTTGKTCPFLDKVCIEDKCALWTELRMGSTGPLGLVIGGKSVHTCYYVASLVISSSSRPVAQSNSMIR